MALYPFFSSLSLICVSLADVSPLSQVPILPCLGYLCCSPHSTIPLEGSCCLLNPTIHLLQNFLNEYLRAEVMDPHSQ